jgi:hypothetical protein
MQAYATVERLATGQRLRALDPIPLASRRHDLSGGESEAVLLDLV